MRSTRLVVAVAFVLGIGVGLVAGPLTGGGATAASPRRFVYRCVKATAFTGIAIQVHNPTTRPATVRKFEDTTERTPIELAPGGTVTDAGVAENATVNYVKFISNRRLLVTAYSYVDSIESQWNTPCFGP